MKVFTDLLQYCIAFIKRLLGSFTTHPTRIPIRYSKYEGAPCTVYTLHAFSTPHGSAQRLLSEPEQALGEPGKSRARAREEGSARSISKQAYTALDSGSMRETI